MAQASRQLDLDANLDAIDAERLGKPAGGWRLRLYSIIFESDTPAGKRFDVALILAILLSVVVVLVDSVDSMAGDHGTLLDVLEWFFTLLFTVEYVCRLACVRHPARYAMSFFGIVDLVSILPTYLAVLIPEAHALIDVRILRLLRVFRIFKLSAYGGEYRLLGAAIAASRRKILVFLSVVMMIVLIVGTLMYIIEGPAGRLHHHTDRGVLGNRDYDDRRVWRHHAAHAAWAALAAFMMLIGWGILAVPTGIVTAEMTAQRFGLRPTVRRTCAACRSEGHESDARYCRKCGAPLPDAKDAEHR